MLYPLSYRGTSQKRSRCYHALNVSRQQPFEMHGKSSIVQDSGGQNKEAAVSSTAVSHKNTGKHSLGSPGPFARLGEDTPPIKCIIYDLAHCRSVWIDIHTVAGSQMSKNAFSSDVQSCSH